MAKKTSTETTPRKSGKFGAWIIMGLLFVGLIGFGGAGLTGSVRSIGTVGEKQISTQLYFQQLNGQIAQQSSQVGRSISFPEAEQAGIPEFVLQSVIGQRALWRKRE